jgi:hypothetical protein
VRTDLAATLRDRVAQDMADSALRSFVKDLEGKRFSPKDAADFVANHENIKNNVFRHGIMAEARDELSIADDPALAPLRRAEEKDLPFTPSRLRQFAEQFFTSRGVDGRVAQTQPFQPRPISDFRNRGATYYFWLTESEKPRVLTFAEARPQVEAAWRLNQARKEARQAAEQIVADMKKRGEGIAADRFLKDKAEQLKAANPKAGYETFDLIGISRLVRSDAPLLAMGLTTRYDGYKFPEKDLAYPRADTVDELLKQLKQPGDAVVFADRPERNYFVALLEERKVPSEKEFYEVYQHAPRGLISDSLWSRFQAERDQKYRAAIIRHMREEALAPLDDQGNFKIDPEVRKRLRGGPGEE